MTIEVNFGLTVDSPSHCPSLHQLHRELLTSCWFILSVKNGDKYSLRQKTIEVRCAGCPILTTEICNLRLNEDSINPLNKPKVVRLAKIIIELQKIFRVNHSGKTIYDENDQQIQSDFKARNIFAAADTNSTTEKIYFTSSGSNTCAKNFPRILQTERDCTFEPK